MMSLSAIREESRKATQKASKSKKKPYLVHQEDLDDDIFPPFPFPFIGEYVPTGWNKINEYFVDSSGFGSPGEPALTIGQFTKKIRVGYGYAITEVGQFQVYIGEYEKSKKL